MDRLRRLAELAVGFGANVQPGQIVRITCEVGHLEVARAVAEAAYRHGARFVDVDFADPYVQRARVLYGPSDGYLPRWREARIRELDEERGANIKITGPTAPGLFDDLDPACLARATGPQPSLAWREVEYRVNNTVVPGPTLPWAQSLRRELAAADALDALWDDITVACRLDAADPVAAWRARFDQLRAQAELLTSLRLGAVRLRGPGTDLLVGLPASARWEHAGTVNERGIDHAWNVPSEEVYTVPDRTRVHGHARLTRPALVAGRLVDGVELSFRGGRAIDASGGPGVEALREFIARDPGNARLGELALVDADSRVAQTRQTFRVILLDENAASHIALGFGFPELVGDDDRGRVNISRDHLDVTVGSDEIEATGITADGYELPILRAGRWQTDQWPATASLPPGAAGSSGASEGA